MGNGGATTCAVGVKEGQVVIEFPDSVRWATFDPETARQLGEAIARAAYEARFGVKPNQNKSSLADSVRTRLHLNATHMIRSMVDQRVLPGRIAQKVVDYVLTEVT